jgi:hypothetical protein
MVVGSMNTVGGIHAPSKVSPVESVSESIPNTFPELRPGGSFMNLLLAADWVAGQLAVDGVSDAERLELVEAHVSLVCQMRAEVSKLSRVKLSNTNAWLERVRALAAKLGTAAE